MACQKIGTTSWKSFSPTYPLVEDMYELQICWHLSPQPSGRRKTWCQETLCHLRQGTGWYLASWSCLCSAVLGHGGGGCPSTALHRHDQLAKYHPVPWLRWHNVSWHQVFRFRLMRQMPGNLKFGYVVFEELWRIIFMKIMEFDLKWVHMARYELILKLDGALWLRIILKPLRTPNKG